MLRLPPVLCLPVLSASLLLVAVPVPSSGGPYQDYKTLTRAEKWLALRYPWQLLKVRSSAERARAESERRYPTQVGQDDPRDAFRHTFWNGAMTGELRSTRAAARWANAHEAAPGNPAARRAMDLFNNERGRRIADGAKVDRRVLWWTRATYPDDPELAVLVQDALDRGELRMIEERNGARDPHGGRLVPTR